MTPRPEPQLRKKLLAWLLAPLALLLLVDTAIAYWNTQRFSNLAYDRALQEVAREIALHVRVEQGQAQLQLSEAAAHVLLRDQDDLLFFRVTARDGRLLGGDATLAEPPPPEPVAGAAGFGPRFYNLQMRGQPVRVASLWLAPELGSAQGLATGPSSPSDAPDTLVHVMVAETLHKRERLGWEMLATVVVPQVLLLAMAALVVSLGISRGLAPLKQLRQAVSSRSHLDLSPVDTRAVPGEVRPLVDEVNQLMARLNSTFSFQNRFVADAAHQLKTPVSGLKAQIELALRESDPERVRHSLAQLYLSADRLSRLVQQLLTLARNEPGALAALQLQPLDMEAFALEVCMEWVPEALKRDIDLGFEGSGRALVINADPDRLRELINNLLDNAIRYSRATGRVTVRTGLHDDGRHCQLSFSDDGPSIPVHERQRIFERFHRLLGTTADGSGLGLAIVSEIASLHGARITLEDDTDGVGNAFKVFFPLRMPAA
jgi:two-component system, OmpR family, sensor histidine kinase TctE